MDKQTLIIQLGRQKANSDLENAHMIADQLLLEFIDDEEVSQAFFDIDKWYA